MEISLYHFINEDENKEYIVLLESTEDAEYKEDAEADGYTLENVCPLENASITLPLRTLLMKEF